MKKIASLFLLLSTLTFAQQSKTNLSNYNMENEVPKDSSAIRGELSNGLKYYIKENNKPEDVVYLNLIVKAGRLQEDQSQQGLAHLLEHMGFNGTKHFKKDKLIKYFESIGMKFGSDLNASTGFYETKYKLKVPSKDLKKVSKAFQVLEDWAHNMLLKDEDIDDERPVVLEEFRRKLGSSHRVGKEINEFLYDGMKHVKYFSDDKLENIKNFDTDHMRRFYKDWYRPNLMGVVVAGDIDPAFAEAQIKKYFSEFENPVNQKAVLAYDSVPYHKGTRVKIVTDPEKTRTSISLSIIDESPIREERALVKHLKNSIVRSMMLTMVNRRLIELSNSNNPPFMGAGISRQGTIARNHSQFSIGASSSEAGINKALEHMIIELERVKRFGFTEEELNQVKKSLTASNETFLEKKDDWYSSSYLSLLESEFRNSWVFYDKDWRYEYYKTTIPQITLAEVKNLFLEYYKKDNRALILTAPEKEDLVLPTEEELLETISNAELNTNLIAYKPKELGSQLIKDLKPKGSIVSEESHLYGIKELKLSNGARVFYKNTDFEKEQVSFKSFSYGGRSLLSDEESTTIGSLMSITTSTGIGGFKHHELSKFLSGKKVKVSSYVGEYDEGLRGSVRTKDLETLFKLVYLNFTSRNKDEAMYNTIVEKIRESNKNRKMSPGNIFSSKIRNVRYKGNPRYIDLNENNKLEHLLDSVPYKKLHDAYVERFENAGDFNFFFIGEFDEDLIKSYSETYLASLPSTEERESYKISTFKKVLSEERLEVKKGLEDKATLSISFMTEAKYNSKENDAMKIFGQIYKTRLREKIREEKGGVYTVRANLSHSSRPFSRYVASISFSCAPKNIDVLEKESLAVLNEFLKEGPSKREVANVKKNWILGREKSMKKNSYWFNYMYNKVYWKKDFEEIKDYEEKLSDINPKYIKKIANKYIGKPELTAKLLPASKKE